jgi:methionine--tRNA ligase beta chain
VDAGETEETKVLSDYQYGYGEAMPEIVSVPKYRQIVAGIRKSYSNEQLVGKNIVLVCNLAPAVIRGVESQGMLLAASDEDGISVISPDRTVKTGSKVK